MPRKRQCTLLLSLVVVFLGSYYQLLQARVVQNLNSSWEFIKSDINVKDAAKDEPISNTKWKKVTIPHTWNNLDVQSGGNYYTGTGCYRRELFVDNNMKGKRFFLRFEGVGQVAEVYVNGIPVGTHKGAYSAFCLEITPILKFGQNNLILVKANNQPRPDIIPVTHTLFMVYGGIYRPVSLIITNKINITPLDYASPGIYIRQKNVSHKSADVFVTSKLEDGYKRKADVLVKTTIFDKDNNVVATTQKKVSLTPSAVTPIQQHLKVVNPTLWNARKNPYLYHVKVEVVYNQQVVDEVTQPLGLRYFSMDPNKGFILNGKPYRLYGVCRHQEWQNCGSALTNQQHKIDFDMIYDLGATSVRLAHYQQAEYVYSYCDKLGLVVWAEVPFVATSTGQERDNAKQQLRELIRQNYNHPSIFIWGMGNEVPARNQASYPVRLTRELQNLAKSEDPDRWTVTVTGYGTMNRPMEFHADLQGNNRYYGWYYGKPGDLGKWIESTKKLRPDNFFFLSEYGAGGNVAHQQENPTKPNAISGQFFPEQYQSYIHEIQWPAIASHPFLCGSYIWNMFDFTVPKWNKGGIKARNHKGLVTYDRTTKKDAFYYYKANWSPKPVLHIRDKRLVNRLNVHTTIKVYSNCDNVQLQLNGQNQPLKYAGYCVYTCKATLKNGTNTLIATARGNGKIYRDSCNWVFDARAARARAIKAQALARLKANKTVLASSVESAKPSVPVNTLDGNPKTYWSTDEKNPWIRYKFTKAQPISRIGILWYNGSKRVYPFEIDTSMDGKLWHQVYKGKSHQTATMEYYNFPSRKTKYIRIRCHGNNKTSFSAICEVKAGPLVMLQSELDISCI